MHFTDYLNQEHTERTGQEIMKKLTLDIPLSLLLVDEMLKDVILEPKNVNTVTISLFPTGTATSVAENGK